MASLFQKLEEIEARYQELNEQLGRPETLADKTLYQKTAKAHRELMPIVEKHRQWKEIEKSIVDMALRLGDRRVSALMTPRTQVEWLDLEDPLEETQQKIRESHYSRFPVAEGGRRHIVGVVEELWDAGAGGVILGCTELELLVKQADSELPVFPCTTLHVSAALDRALA